jgi:hypothetical protein
MEELKNTLVKSLYIWMGAFNISQFSNFSDFVDFCSSFSHQRGFLLYTSCVLWLHPIAFNKMHYLSKETYISLCKTK